MKEVIRVLMKRDKITKKEAEAQVAKCRAALEHGNYEALQDYLALEDDYIFDILDIFDILG